MPDEPYCDLCDLPLAFCSHGRAAARAAAPAGAPAEAQPGAPAPATIPDVTAPGADADLPARASTGRVSAPATPPAAPVRRPSVPGFLEVSPEQVAHFPGCPDKGEDLDFDAWGLVTRATDLAWRELGEGTPVPCDSGPRASLVATTRCATCDGHGTWL